MTLKTAINEKNINEIRKFTNETPVADIAHMLEELLPSERVVFFRLLKTDLQSEIFSYLEPEYQEDLIASFTDQQVRDIVADLYTDEIADLVEDVPDEMAKRILAATNKETRAMVNKLLRYSDDETGSIMNVDIVLLKQSMTVSEARKLIREKKDDIRMAHYFFVTDSQNKLVGHIAIEDLLFEIANTPLRKILKPIGYVTTTTNKEEAALIFAEHNMSVLPVINSSKIVIGMITSQDVIDIFQEEASDDIHKMAGIGEQGVSYSKQSVISIFKSRILWLMLLMLSATLSQIVLDGFQNLSSIVIPSVTTAIVAILPVISGAAGNAGSQSSTTVIRALAIGDISSRDYLKVVFKESRVSILVGLALGVVNFARLLIYYAIKGDFDTTTLMLSFAASISLVMVIFLAKVVGGALPLLAKSLKLDPAVMAAPLLTTLIDALSITIFFSISIGIMSLVF